MTGIEPLLLTASDTLGAGNATRRIHGGLREIGVDSTMLVRQKSTDDPTIAGPRNALGKALSRLNLRSRLDSAPLALYDDAAQFSVNWVPDLVHRRVDAVDPDLVHLNWVAGGFMSVGTLGKLDRPLVWRLPDVWPLTGGCHYPGECTGYLDACGNCPQLGSDRTWDLSHVTMRRKRRALADAELTVVATTPWLASLADESALFGDRRVEVIPNGLDTDVFRPVEPSVGRELFDLPDDRPLVLFGSVNPLSNSRKGYDLLQSALETLEATTDLEPELVVFGTSTSPDLGPVEFPTHCTGYLNDEQSLAVLYSAADVMVVPSRFEGFGQTVSESLACGTPVVAFDASGPASIVDHEETGYLATPYDPSDLAAGIEWLLTADAAADVGATARDRAVERFHVTDVAIQYRNLYQDIA